MRPILLLVLLAACDPPTPEEACQDAHWALCACGYGDCDEDEGECADATEEQVEAYTCIADALRSECPTSGWVGCP